jgi:hypothetical protein
LSPGHEAAADEEENIGMRNYHLGRPMTMSLIAAIPAVLFVSGPDSDLRADAPLVVFDVPYAVECRDVTPGDRSTASARKIIEAVVKISPQMYAGEEQDIKRLHYEISTQQQMPVVGFLPNSEVATDVAGGTIAIQSSEHHGNLSFRYLVMPGTGNGQIRGDLESSRARYGLLAPKQVLVAAGTIERGCGVYYDLRYSTQDTLERPRDFACLFEVARNWRADYLTVRCKAQWLKPGFAGVTKTEADCGAGLLCVGLYMADDDQARAYAEAVAKKQQLYFGRLAVDAKEVKAKAAENVLVAVVRQFSGQAMRGSAPKMKLGAALESNLDEHQELREQLPARARDASKEFDAVKHAIRTMNGK